MTERWFIARLADNAPPDTSRRLADRAGTEVRKFARLPLVVVGSDEDLTISASTVPGVEEVRQVVEDDAKVIDGIDRLTLNAGNLDARLGLNGNLGLLPNATAGDIPAYPRLNLSGERPLMDPDTQLFLPTRLGRLAAINLSMGTIEFAAYDECDPVNVATRLASRLSVVVAAAGNDGRPEAGEETLSAWAQPPWVLSVGATDRADGGEIQARSSRGDPDDRATWPDVVAYGASRLDESLLGTSFAAPRVTRQVGLLTAFVLVLRSLALRYLGNEEEGVPVVWLGFVDRRIDLSAAEPEMPLSALPRNVIDEEKLARAIHLLQDTGSRIDLCPAPERIREVLLDSARPLEGAAPWEAGRGFVNDETTERWAARCSGLELARLFAGSPSLDRSQGRQLKDLRFSGEREVGALFSVVAMSFGVLAFDLASYDNPVTPRPAVPGPSRAREPGAEVLSIAREAA